MPSGLCIVDPARWFDDVLGGFSTYPKIGHVSWNPIFGGASFIGKCFLVGDSPMFVAEAALDLISIVMTDSITSPMFPATC